MAKATPPAIEDLFEHIEDAVAALEGGELPLEQALTRYEAGLRAMKQARAILDRYAARLEHVRTDEDTSGGVAADEADEE